MTLLGLEFGNMSRSPKNMPLRFFCHLHHSPQQWGHGRGDGLDFARCSWMCSLLITSNSRLTHVKTPRKHEEHQNQTHGSSSKSGANSDPYFLEMLPPHITSGCGRPVNLMFSAFGRENLVPGWLFEGVVLHHIAHFHTNALLLRRPVLRRFPQRYCVALPDA